MAAKEDDVYAKVTPRRQRQSRPTTVKHGSALDVLLSMGFPKTRALKALVSTGGKNVQAACDWLFSHVDDPFLDDPLPREYVLYLRPSGPLLQQLSLFWQQSRLSCGKNKAHNIFPHITLCQFFMIYSYLKLEMSSVCFLRSHSILNCASPSNSGTTVGGLLFDGQINDTLLDSLVDPPSLAGLCPPMQVSRPTSQSSLSKMRLFVCRHGERMDVVFGKHWVTQCFDSKGRYVRSNLNMPSSLPARGGGHRDYDKDCPITVFGSTQARLVGEALLESHAAVDFIYCSPSLRCVQTAQHILQGLQQEGKTKLRVEPGLFEWTKWVSGTCLPSWIPPAELAAANLSVDTTYRPHIPISKLVVSESYDTYISRSFQVTREILAQCKNLGNTVLIVAHASSLEACTRQIQGLSPQNSKDFVQVVRKIPYLGFCACEEMGETGVWQLTDPPIMPLTHGPNHSFNWREMLTQD
nr:PREDICTED: ubiquitin-associated and SH3 domain-containing protein B-like [Paralichthys olivaceus]